MPVDMETLEAIRGDYPLALAQQAALEAAYYYLFAELPWWAAVIERVEELAGGRVWVHRDPAATC